MASTEGRLVMVEPGCKYQLTVTMTGTVLSAGDGSFTLQADEGVVVPLREAWLTGLLKQEDS